MATVAAWELVAGMSAAAAGGYGAYESGQSQKAAAEYQAQVAANNQKLAGAEANVATQQGQQEVGQKQQQTAGMIGAIRAGYGASGLDPNVGTAMRVQGDAAKLGAEDQSQISYNAMQEAYGLRNQGISYAANAQLLQQQSQYDAQQGALGGYSSLVGKATPLIKTFG